MDHFIDKIQKRLKLMSEKEKDEWIISQAKITPEWKQEDIYKSICGTKKVINMPERTEIDEFCEKVKDGDIVVEYETHYVEFDDYGHFHDDWEHDFHDPSGAMIFLSSVFHGCHDLVILEEYEQAFEILDELMGLQFTIENHPDTDDACEDEFLDLAQAVREGMLSIDREDVLRDYIEACRKSAKVGKEAARKITSAFEMELFRDCKPYTCITLTAREPLLGDIKNMLEKDLEAVRKDYDEKSRQDEYYWGQYRAQERMRRIKELIEYFGIIGEKKQKPKESFLRGTWSQIKGLIRALMNEPYIDDQMEIEEIWNIVEALIKRGGFDMEPWEMKEKILKEIYDNDFFDYYGVYDPMHDLAEAICATREENLKRAEIMMNAGSGYLGSDAAKLYRELGEERKCAEYFEKHLGKQKEAYEIVIDYYRDSDYNKAIEIARLAVGECNEDLTSFFILLLQDARDRGDETDYKKLMRSAHMRRAVKSSEIDAIFS